MIYSEDLETIKDFALADRDNLSSFLRICSCFEQVKAHLRNDFIRILKIFLQQNLDKGGWELQDRMSDKWDKPYPTLIIFKTKFNLIDYHVAMDSESRVAKMMLYGVRNGDGQEKPSKPSREKNEKIWKILNEKVEQEGRLSDWWSWYKYLERPYDDWNNSELLMKMFESVNLYESQKEFAPIVNLIGYKLVNAALALDSWFESRGD